MQLKLLFKQKEITMYTEENSDKDTQIRTFKDVDKTNKQLITEITKLKQKKEGNSVTDAVRE